MDNTFKYMEKMTKKNFQLIDEVRKEKDEKNILQKKISQLEKEIIKKEKELENLREICDMWWGRYDVLYDKYSNLEAKHDFVNYAFASLVPKLSKCVEEDYDEKNFFSEIISNFKRSRW